MNPSNEPDLSVPPAVVPPVAEEPRYFAGWIFLGTILFLMFALSMVGSLMQKPKAKKTEPPVSPYSIVLETEVSQLRLFDRLPQTAGQDMKEARQQALDTLRGPISNLASKSRTDAEASRYYAAMRTERGDPVSAEMLAPLRNSANAADRTLAEIYGSEKLTRAKAEELARKLPNDPFLYQLARVHALEKSGDRNARNQTFTGNKAIAVVLGSLASILLAIGSAVAWSMFRNALREGKLKDAAMPLNQISLADADRLAMRAAQVFGVFFALDLLTSLLLGKGTAAPFVSGVGILLAIPLLARLPVNGKIISPRAMGMNGKNFGRNVLWGIGGFFAELPVTLIMMGIGTALFRFLPAPSHPVTEELLNLKNLLSALPLVFFGSITAPIWEEFVFRGLMFNGLARVVGRVVPAAVMTGFAFAMVHPQGIALWLALATVGVMGCGLTYYTRSLVPTIVMHMLHNSAIFVAVLMLVGAKP